EKVGERIQRRGGSVGAVQLLAGNFRADEHGPGLPVVRLTPGGDPWHPLVIQSCDSSQVGPKPLKVVGAVEAEVGDKAFSTGADTIDVSVFPGDQLHGFDGAGQVGLL